MIAAKRVLLGPVGETVDDGAVLVEDQHVTDVGSRAEIASRVRPGAARMEYGEATVLPGLINAHVHLAFEPGTDHEQRLTSISDGELTLSMAEHARALLDGGVTTARDLGDRRGSSVAVRDAIAAGDVVGPRILAAGPLLTTMGGHCWFLGGELPASPDGYESAIRLRVRELAGAGVDVIKVMASGGQITNGGASMWECQFTGADLRAVVDEASRAGLPVAVHAHGSDSIADAVSAGVSTVEHCSWMAGPGESDFRADVADRMAATRVVACTGSTGDSRMLADRVPPERLRELFGRMRRMADHGVQVVFGSDAGLSAFDDFGRVLVNWSEWGFEAPDVIELATTGAARGLGLESVTGRIAPGMAADLLVVDGDPRVDLESLGRVRAVVARGRLHRPAARSG